MKDKTPSQAADPSLTFAPPPCLALISPQPLFSIMDIELLPTVSLLPETFSILVAPVELLAGAINSHPELQRYKILFISGNYSRILSSLEAMSLSWICAGPSPPFSS